MTIDLTEINKKCIKAITDYIQKIIIIDNLFQKKIIDCLPTFELYDTIHIRCSWDIYTKKIKEIKKEYENLTYLETMASGEEINHKYEIKNLAIIFWLPLTPENINPIKEFLK